MLSSRTVAPQVEMVYFELLNYSLHWTVVHLPAEPSIHLPPPFQYPKAYKSYSIVLYKYLNNAEKPLQCCNFFLSFPGCHDCPGLTHSSIDSYKKVITVSSGKNMYSFGAPTALACPSVV